MRRDLRLVSLAVVALGVAVVAGAAFACTAQAYIWTEPGEATAGSTITVQGRQWVPDTPVEVRWVDSQGMLLGTAVPGEAADFSIQVVVPDVEPGKYTIYAASYDSEGRFLGSSSYGFTVSVPPGAEEPAPSEPVVEQTTSGSKQQRPDERPGSGHSETRTDSAAPPEIAGVTVVGGREVFTASVPERADRQRRADADRSPVDRSAVPPSERFGPGEQPSRDGTVAAPGLGALDPATPEDRQPLGYAGAVLLALGLIGLGAGGLAAEMLRRKKPAQTR